MRATVLAVLVAGTILLALALPSDGAAAHANQIRSSPAPDARLDEPPERVIVWFSEGLEPNFSNVRVFNSAGERVDDGDSAVESSEPRALVVSTSDLSVDAYLVSWVNVSVVDGHRVVGSFNFTVGDTDAVAVAGVEEPLLQSAAEPWISWLFLTAGLTMVGALLFELMVVRRVVRGAPPVWLARTTRLTALVSAAALVVLQLLALANQTVTVQGGGLGGITPATVGDIVLSSWGRFWLAQALLALLALGLSLAARRGGGLLSATPLGLLILLSGAGILTANSFSSHAAALEGDLRIPAVMNDLLHTAAAAVWVGGILFLVMALLLRRRSGDHAPFAWAPLLGAFTPIAVAAASALVLSGTLASFVNVASPAALATPYGWVLLAKVLLLLPLAAIAALNALVVVPRLARGGDGRTIRWTVSLELVLAVAIVACAGWLTSLEPAQQYAVRNNIGVSDSALYETVDQGAELSLEVSPARTGLNDVTLTLSDDGEPLQGVLDVRLRLTSLEQELGEEPLALIQEQPGVWVAREQRITIGGHYEAQVRVTRSDALDTVASFRFDTTAIRGAAVPRNQLTNTVWLLLAGELLLLAVLVVGLALPAIRRDGLINSLAGRLGVAAAVVGVLLAVNVFTVRVGLLPQLENPFPLSGESIAIGSTSYTTHCSSCHGEQGVGDGPAAAALAVPPSDLQIHIPLHTDVDLFTIVQNGFPASGMPAFDDLIDDDAKWHLINYLRDLTRDELALAVADGAPR